MRRFWILSFVILVGCLNNKHTLDEQSLNNFINDEGNGLRKSVATDSFELNLSYRPTGLIARQQMQTETKKEFDSLVSSYSKYLYFTLDISKHGKDLETAFASDLASFGQKISFLSSDFAQNIKVVTKKNTIPILDCIYVRSYGIGPSRCLIVIDKPADDFTLQIEAHSLGIGKQTFDFALADISNAPKLKTEFL